MAQLAQAVNTIVFSVLLICLFGPQVKAVDGSWGDWTAWGECSSSCGEGTRHRSRECDSPEPSDGGKSCAGAVGSSQDQSKSCDNLGPCPVDGGWSEWSPWGDCSITCGGGVNWRTRVCDNPVKVGTGKDCEGENSTRRACNEEPCPPPLPPSALTSVAETNSLELSWTAPSGDIISLYQVNLEDSSDTKSKNVTETKATFTDLKPGQMYTVTIKGQKAGIWSEPLKKEIYTRLGPATNIRLEPGRIDVEVRWDRPRGKVETINVSVIEFSTKKVVKTSSRDATFISFDSLKPGTKYSVEIVAVNKRLRGEVAKAEFNTIPDPARDVAATATKTSLKVSWAAPELSQDIAAYEVELKGVTGTKRTVTMPQAVFSGLQPGTSYTVVVVSVSGATKGNAVEKSVITKADLCATKPCLNGGTCEDKTDGIVCKCASGYTGKRCDKIDGGWSEWSPWGDCSVTCGGGVNWRTRVCDNPVKVGTGKDCEGENSTRRACNEEPCPSPLPPSALTTVAETNSLELSWTAPSGDIISLYQVNLEDGSDTKSKNVTETKATFTDLKPGQMYTVTIKGQKAGIWSEPLKKEIYTRLGPATNIRLEPGSIDVEVRWDRPRGKVETINVSVIEFSTKKVVKTSSRDATFISFDSLKPGTKYTVEIVPVNKGLRGEVAKAEFNTIPDPARDVAATATKTSLKVSWAAPELSQDIAAYEVELKGVTGTKRTVTMPQAVFSGLQPGTSYTVVVVSVSGATKGNAVEKSVITSNTTPFDGNMIATRLDSMGQFKNKRFFSYSTKFMMPDEHYNKQLANHSSHAYWALYLKIEKKMKDALQDSKVRILSAENMTFQAGSIKVSLRVITNVSHTAKEVENHIVSLAKFGALVGLVDPTSIHVIEPITVPNYKVFYDACESQPCQFGSTCLNFRSDITCQCPKLTYGVFCQMTTPDDNPILHPKKTKPYDESMRVTFIIICLLLTIVLIVLVVVLALKIRNSMANRQVTVAMDE